jgi:protein translocase SecG subunit
MTAALVILAAVVLLILLSAMLNLVWLLGLLFVLVCVFLIGAVLLQKGKGGGLGAALGGAGTSAFGTKTGDAWTVVTIVLTSLYLLIAAVATYTFSPEQEKVAAPFFTYKGASYTEGTVEVPSKFDVTLGSTMPGTTIWWARGDQPLNESQYVDNGQMLRDLEFPEGQDTLTLRIQAHRSRFEGSDIREVTFVQARPPVQTVTFGPDPGQIDGPTAVTLATETPEAEIHYTLDGSEPTRQSPTYDDPIQVTPGMTVKAIAVREGFKDSPVAVARYLAAQGQGPQPGQPLPAPVIAPAGSQEGISEPVEVTLSVPEIGEIQAEIYYTLDGSEPTRQGQKYDGPIQVQPGQTVRAKAFAEGFGPSSEAKAVFNQAQQGAAAAAPRPAA